MRTLLIALAIAGCTTVIPSTTNEEPLEPNTTLTVSDARLPLSTLVDDAFPNAYPTIVLVNTAQVDQSIVEVTSTISANCGMNINTYGDDWVSRESVKSFTLPAGAALLIQHRDKEVVLYNSEPPPAGGQFDITFELADATALTFPVVVEP